MSNKSYSSVRVASRGLKTSSWMFDSKDKPESNSKEGHVVKKKEESSEKNVQNSDSKDNKTDKKLSDAKVHKSDSDKDTNSNKNTDKPPTPNKPVSLFALTAMVTGVFLSTFLLSGMGQSFGAGEEITLQHFLSSVLPEGNVDKIVVSGDRAIARVFTTNPNASLTGQPIAPIPSHYFTLGSLESFENLVDIAEQKLGLVGEKAVPIQYEPLRMEGLGEIVRAVAWFSLNAVLVYVLWRNFKGSSDLFNLGPKSKSYFVEHTKVPTRFSDVAGLREAKQEIMEFVSFLKQPERYRALGAKIPKGALLVGPPGTGKTLLAKATAGEAEVPFISMSGSDFVEMFVGVGPSRVRELFKKAREKAPCILFIDEIDGVGKSRSKGFSANDERENTLNQLLVEMDGFNTTQSPVIVLAGTNRADILDKALLRPGRFDRQITVDNPDLGGRVEIFKVHLKPLKLKDELDGVAEKLAEVTPGFSGAEIANVCNEAALIAARMEKGSVEMEDFHGAIDRIIGGLEKKSRIISPEERKVVAYHEAGHAVAGWFLRDAAPLLKVSIVPRGIAALGYAQYNPPDIYLHTTEQLMDQMCMTLGGRIAESLMFNKISTGAQDDLEKVTSQAYAQVAIYGMNKRLGPVAYPEDESEFGQERMFGEKTAEVIDLEVRELISEAYTRTEKLLTEKMDLIESMAQELLKKEVLLADDVVKLLGERPYPSPPNWKQYKEALEAREERDKAKMTASESTTSSSTTDAAVTPSGEAAAAVADQAKSASTTEQDSSSNKV